MLQYSCLEKLLPDREAWQATVYRAAKSWTLPKQPCMRRHKTFFTCGSSAPGRVGHEGDTAAWLAGTLAAPGTQGHGLSLSEELWPSQNLSLSLLPLVIRRLLWPVFVHSAPSRHLEASLTWGPSLLFGASGTLRGPPGWGPTL